MKVSILIAIGILAIAGVFGWQGQQELDRVKTDHERVVEEASALGIAPGDGSGTVASQQSLKRERKDRELEVQKLVEEVITFAKRMKEMENSGGGPDDELQKETMQMMKRFLDLDAHQLKHMIALLRESTEIDDEMRNGIAGFSIMMLATENPEAALTLYTESFDLLEMDGMKEHVVSSALGQWAAKDPFGALEWIRANGEKHPDLVTDDVKAAVIAGTAGQDLALAMDLVGDLDLEGSYRAADGIARSMRTPEERSALLGLLRSEERGVLGDQIFTSMGSRLAAEGFDSSVEWLEKAELGEGEMNALFDGISYPQTKGETGEWIEWAGEHLKDEAKMKPKVKGLMSNWTRQDYVAAGTWLNEMEGGPVKESAVVAYAETVASYEPASAAEWAATLPEGGERTQLVKQIHREWKKTDEAAAAAFAAEQGIE